MTDRSRALFLASTLALLFGLGLWATAVEAQNCAGTFPATGQTTSYSASTRTETGAPVLDDGAVQAGGALSYQDNGDGTITDPNTQLMWEKKSQDGGLHDVSMTFPYASSTITTIWDWLARVNAEDGIGFAGYNDWRIPNVKELQSVVDYGTFDPAVDPAFNNGVSPACTVLTCSATASDSYWSSSALAKFPEKAWIVTFYLGTDFGEYKLFDPGYSHFHFVRAVRGGCVP